MFLKYVVEIKQNALKHPPISNQTLEFFRKDMFLQVNNLMNQTHCSVMNTLIELKSFIDGSDDYLKNKVTFMSLIYTYYSEFIKFICSTLTVIPVNIPLIFQDYFSKTLRRVHVNIEYTFYIADKYRQYSETVPVAGVFV